MGTRSAGPTASFSGTTSCWESGPRQGGTARTLQAARLMRAPPGGHFKFPHPWPGQNPPLDSGGTRRSSGTSGALGKTLAGFFQAPALAFELEQMPVVHDAIEKRRDHNHVPQELPPVIYAAVRCDDDGGFLVATHQHVGEFVAGIHRELAQEQIVDDEQFRRGDLSAIFA